jgi:3-phosphoshikimate 1-carboxyvinyltransferase
VPGDKSISHRALMLGALAVGETRIEGLLESEDVLSTANALRAMGSTIERGNDGIWTVHGAGLGALLEPEGPLDMGNSGTSARLLLGLIGGHAISAALIGDASLSRRPMGRVIDPLRQMGAGIESAAGGRLPLLVHGARTPVPITYELPVPSAQVKSAILLAGLNGPGITTIIEPAATRDHTERMLDAFGAEIEIDIRKGERRIALTGQPHLRPQAVSVPGDPSSAAFLLVAALLVEGSELTIMNVGMNPTRSGLVTVLREMGAQIDETNARTVGGEPVADLVVRHSSLHGVEVDPALAPSLIDEFPALFVAAALAEGRTVTTGLAELRVKESDRLATMAAGLALAGGEVEEQADGLTITGTAGKPLDGTPPGSRIAVDHDHRIAMSMIVAGLASRRGVVVEDVSPIATSFPNFLDLLTETRA